MEIETTIKLNGVNCIKGEIHSILTLMRVNSTWSKYNYNNNTNKIDENNDESVFVSSFRQLNQYLEGIYELSQVDCVLYITPFHLIITSDQANGPLTCAALGSLVKFISYGLLQSSYPRCKEAMTLLSQCVATCIFEETDWESDEVILMKLLELSALIYRCNASVLLTISNAWDIYSTCIAIHSQYRASKILRSEAETALRNITLSAFSRAQSTNFTINSDIENGINDDSNDNKTWETASKNYCFDGMIGITLLLGKVMIVLSGLMDLQKNTLQYVSFSLTLINIALEAGGSSLSYIPTLVDILRGDVCRHLLIASQSDDLGIFSLSLRVIFNLFISIKDHMKIQLEVFLISIHLRLLSINRNISNPITSSNQSIHISLAREELVLESLLEFCREPLLMQDLYTNYDCDVQCTNLFDNIIFTLCYKSLPNRLRLLNNNNSNTSVTNNDRLTNTLDIDNLTANEINSLQSNILNKIAIDGVLSIIHAISVRCLSYHKIITVRASNAIENESNKPSIDIGDSNESRSNNIFVTPIKSNNKIVRSTRNYNVSPDIINAKSLIHIDPAISPTKELKQSVSMSVSNSSSISSNYSSSDNEEINFNPLIKTTDEEIDDDDADFVLLARARTAEILRQRKLKKQRLRLAAEKFNIHPLKVDWLRYALEQGLISYAMTPNNSVSKSTGKASYNDTFYLSDPKSVAKFLRHTPGLGKTQIGEFISKGPADLYPFHAMVLREYVNTFDFSGKHSAFHKALRLFLGHFRLPGEAQCIDRIMESFAGKLFQQLGQGRPFKSADSVFILAFSTIMLNTDLHNPQIPINKKMTKEQFVKNNRGINDGEDLPKEYLESLYDEIKNKQIQVDVDISDNQPLNHFIDYTDSVSWNKLINSRHTLHAPAAFTSTETAREEARNNSIKTISTEKITQILSILHEKDMFLVIIHQVVEVLVTTWIYTKDDQIIRKIVEGFINIVNICNVLELNELLESFIIVLSNRSLQLLQKLHTYNPVINQSSTPTNKLSWDDLYDTASQIESEKKTQLQSNNITSDFTISIPNIHKSNLEKLITVSIDHLISDYLSYNSLNKWKFSYLIKNELLVKVSIYLSINYIDLISKEVWINIFKILLYSRSRGVLPPPLAVINIAYDCFNSSYITLPHSKFANNCYKNSIKGVLLNNNAIDDKIEKKSDSKLVSKRDNNLDNQVDIKENNSSVWLSIGGLLGITSTKSIHTKSAITSNQTIDGMNGYNKNVITIQSYIRTLKSNQSIYLFDGNTSPYTKQLHERDEMLKLVLLTCRLDNILLSIIKDYNINTNLIIFDTIINLLNELINYSLSTNSNTIQAIVDQDSNNYIITSGCVEMNMIMLLEWLTSIFLSNCYYQVNNNTTNKRFVILWGKLYSELYSNIFDQLISQLSNKCCYFIERCMYNILYVNCKLTSDSSLNIKDILDILWSGFHLLRQIPIKYIEHTSGQLAAGILTYIKSFRGIESIDNLERWYMITNLLTIAACNEIGQIFVWDTITYLIDSNNINNNNFAPIRYLILRFLHGSFPNSKLAEDNTLINTSIISSPIKSNNIISTSQINNNYTPFGLLAVLKLTINALIGVTSDSIEPTNVCIPDWNFIDNSNNSNSNHIVLYECKTDILIYTNEMTTIHIPNYISTVPIHFNNKSDVIHLIFDSINIYSNFTNINFDITTTKRSLYCIQALFDLIYQYIDKKIEIYADSNSWCNLISELLDKLPICISNYLNQTSNQTIDTGIYIDICLYSCNIVYNYIIYYNTTIKKSVSYIIIWIKFIQLLSNNFSLTFKQINVLIQSNLSNNNLLNNEMFLNEIFEMLAALLRLLLPPSNLSTNHTTISNCNNNNNFIIDNKNNQSKGLLGYVTTIFGYTGSSTITPIEDSKPKVHVQNPIDRTSMDKNVDRTVEDIENMKLLTNTWKDINIICSNNMFHNYLSTKQPQILNEILKTIDIYNKMDKQITPNSTTSSFTNSSTSNAISYNNSQLVTPAISPARVGKSNQKLKKDDIKPFLV